MKKIFIVPLDNSIVEQFNEKEMVMICGGAWYHQLIKILGGGNGACGNNVNCDNSGNCVQGCACK